MKKLKFGEELHFAKTASLEFPRLGYKVEVRALKQDEWKNIQTNIVAGRDENSKEVNREVEIYIASKGIVDDGVSIFDSDEGRKAIAEMPTIMVSKIVSAIMGFDGMDVRQVEKKS